MLWGLNELINVECSKQCWHIISTNTCWLLLHYYILRLCVEWLLLTSPPCGDPFSLAYAAALTETCSRFLFPELVFLYIQGCFLCPELSISDCPRPAPPQPSSLSQTGHPDHPSRWALLCYSHYAILLGDITILFSILKLHIYVLTPVTA